jgi:hypothetical protein
MCNLQERFLSSRPFEGFNSNFEVNSFLKGQKRNKFCYYYFFKHYKFNIINFLVAPDIFSMCKRCHLKFLNDDVMSFVRCKKKKILIKK